MRRNEPVKIWPYVIYDEDMLYNFPVVEFLHEENDFAQLSNNLAEYII